MCNLGSAIKVHHNKTFYAYRYWDKAWDWDKNPISLTSCYNSYRWEKKNKISLVSLKAMKLNSIPYHNKIGFHAFKTKAECLHQYTGCNYLKFYGKVKLSGKVIEHEFGYRASQCEIISITVHPSQDCAYHIAFLKKIIKKLKIRKENYFVN